MNSPFPIHCFETEKNPGGIERTTVVPRHQPFARSRARILPGRHLFFAAPIDFPSHITTQPFGTLSGISPVLPKQPPPIAKSVGCIYGSGSVRVTSGARSYFRTFTTVDCGIEDAHRGITPWGRSDKKSQPAEAGNIEMTRPQSGRVPICNRHVWP
jgi:hypothetical protein